jgi:hypothetical protein
MSPSTISKSHMWLAAVAIAVLVLCNQTITKADGPGITVNGVTIPESPITHNGLTYVPMRATFEGLGSTVTFQGQTATAVMNGNELLSATIGSNTATIKGATQQLDGPVYETGGRVYIPITALTTIFGAHVEQTATGWNITSTVPHAGLPWWLWALIALVIIGLILWFARRPTQAERPGITIPRNPLVTTLLTLIPTLSVEHRTGIVGSILDTFANRGYNTQAFQDAGTDVAAARAGNADAASGLVQQAASFSPQILRDAITNYAQRVPSFLSGLSPNVASSLRGMIGA